MEDIATLIGAQAITDLLSNAEYRLIPGQSHGVIDKALEPVLLEFFRQEK